MTFSDVLGAVNGTVSDVSVLTTSGLSIHAFSDSSAAHGRHLSVLFKRLVAHLVETEGSVASEEARSVLAAFTVVAVATRRRTLHVASLRNAVHRRIVSGRSLIAVHGTSAV